MLCVLNFHKININITKLHGWLYHIIFYMYIQFTLVIFKMFMLLLQVKATPESLKKLQKSLDSCDMNLPLDLKQYRAGMSLWMKSFGIDISYR